MKERAAGEQALAQLRPDLRPCLLGLPVGNGTRTYAKGRPFDRRIVAGARRAYGEEEGPRRTRSLPCFRRRASPAEIVEISPMRPSGPNTVCCWVCLDAIARPCTGGRIVALRLPASADASAGTRAPNELRLEDRACGAASELLRSSATAAARSARPRMPEP